MDDITHIWGSRKVNRFDWVNMPFPIDEKCSLVIYIFGFAQVYIIYDKMYIIIMYYMKIGTQMVLAGLYNRTEIPSLCIYVWPRTMNFCALDSTTTNGKQRVWSQSIVKVWTCYVRKRGRNVQLSGKFIGTILTVYLLEYSLDTIFCITTQNADFFFYKAEAGQNGWKSRLIIHGNVIY